MSHLAVDAGDPEAEWAKEPAPNGGRIDMGAYGNRPEASRSENAPAKQPAPSER